MAELFLQTKENAHVKSRVLQKRQFFEVEIRDKMKDQKKRHLRSLALGIGPSIKTLVASLPKTLPEIYSHLQNNPQFHKLISKLIIDQIYNSQRQSQSSSLEKYQIFQLQPPDSVQYLKKELCLFQILLKNQGKHADQLFKRYFPLLKGHCRSNNVAHLLFDLINTVASQKQLNWIPINQVISIVQMIQNQELSQISKEQVECYFNLSNNYYCIIKNIPQIKNRIRKILQKGLECFKSEKPKVFFQLCLVLTFHEGKKQVILEENDKMQIKQQLDFHKSMIQGSLIKNLYRQIFYSSNVNLRLLCLKILGNLLIQLKSSFIWQYQKTNPIQDFQDQIKDKGNSMQIFYAFSEVFLFSIYNIPCNQLSSFLQSEFERFNLMLYILENVEENSQKGKSIKYLAEECLWFILENGQEQHKQKLANMLIGRDWKRVFGNDSDIILHCYNILYVQP